MDFVFSSYDEVIEKVELDSPPVFRFPGPCGSKDSVSRTFPPLYLFTWPLVYPVTTHVPNSTLDGLRGFTPNTVGVVRKCIDNYSEEFLVSS